MFGFQGYTFFYILHRKIKLIKKPMKKLMLLFLCLFSFAQINAQSNSEIAGVYIKRASESLNGLDIELAKEHFDKAMKYLDSINTSEIARLGTFIHFELRKYPEAKKYASYYFELAKNRKTEEYAEMVTLSVDINEKFDDELEQKKKIEQERITKEKEFRKIDSLKAVWMKKSDLLSINVDSIYKFNAHNVAIFKEKDFFGLINDIGEIILKADKYKDVLVFDGYFIFKNKIDEPTELFCHNSNVNSSFLLPSISDFNLLSTHFGNVMLPRGNGRLVTYPNNSKEAFVYDLIAKKVVKISNQEEIFDSLKKSDVIDKSNKDGEVKIGKEWYHFGGHLGGGIHPIYAQEGYNLVGFLCSIDGKFLRKNSDFDFIGAFHNNSAQAILAGQVFWINQNGTKINETTDETEGYQGKSKLTKLSNGSYQIKRDDLIILGPEKLEKMSDFLRNYSGK